jgi:hypothetical protein
MTVEFIQYIDARLRHDRSYLEKNPGDLRTIGHIDALTEVKGKYIEMIADQQQEIRGGDRPYDLQAGIENAKNDPRRARFKL